MTNLKNIFLALVLVLSTALSTFAGNKYGLKDNIQDGVILHCFDWTLQDIKSAIPDIAKAGFTAVQTSPVSKGGSLGAAWYDVYRPQDYTIGNGIGSESDLKALCTEAHQYGVKVIVDVVANHTDYPNCTGYMNDKSRYHDPFDVTNWNDRYQVTHGKIGMWDNKTEDSGVENYIHQFVEALKACGVDGIRWDAAKHIGLPSEQDNFWATVPDQSMYNYGEILDGTGGNDNSLFPEYQKYMSITDNGYGNAFANSFNSGQVNTSIGNFNQRGAATAKLVYWGESHDTYANDGGSSKYISQNNIDRAYAVVAGNNGATSLYFSRPSATDKNAIKIGQKGSTHFTSNEVAAVNHMHNVCAGEANYYVHSGNVGAQVRKSGAIIVLGSGGNQNVSVANGAGDGKWLTAGTYTDKVAGGQFTVTSSTISGQVGSTGIAVIYKEDGTGGDDSGDDNNDDTNQYVYFNNPNKWSNVYCFFYNGPKSSAVWPGMKMTYDATVTFKGKTGWYKVAVPSGYTNAKYVLNDGTGANTLSGANAYTVTGAVTQGSNSNASSDNNGGDSSDNGGSSSDNGGSSSDNGGSSSDNGGSSSDNNGGSTTTGNLDSQYATNPNGVGIKKTITVDGDISDWNSSMIIAQGVANDDPRVYRDNSMYEVPIDLYALYGCYDDNNLYLMWEMTNVQDVVAPNDNYPLSQGILYQTMNVPFFIAINTGDSSTKIGNNGKTTTGGTLWSSNITFGEDFNKIIAISTNGANGPYIYSGDSNGLNAKEEYNSKTAGITFKYGLGILSKSVKGINGAYGTNNGRVVGDMTKGNTYVDFNTLGHSSSTMDFHYEMSIPLSKLGITASDVASKGLGVLLIATMGKSGMDSLPYDLTCNDNADQPDTESQANNSFEKSDADNFTVSFARIGK